MTEEETMDAGALRELAGPIRAAITNAYYDARNEGWSMETAADNAQAAVLSLLAAAREPVAPAEAEPPTACQQPVWDGPYRMTCGRQLVNGECGRHGRQDALAQPPAPPERLVSFGHTDQCRELTGFEASHDRCQCGCHRMWDDVGGSGAQPPAPASAETAWEALFDELTKIRHGLEVLHSPHFGWGCNAANCSGQEAIDILAAHDVDA